MKDLQTILTLAIEYLKKRKISRSRLVAETLLAHCLDLQRIQLYMHFDRPLTDKEIFSFRETLKRAGKNEPMEYILGEIQFYDTSLIVNSSVLIPRQETEILLDMCCGTITPSVKTALDLCCGSGCLSIGLKKKFPHIEIIGVDISGEALKIAKENAKRNRVEITWLQGDLTEPVKEKSFDLILCNPPYVSSEEYTFLDPGVKNYEPEEALHAGPTGYEYFERLQKELPPILSLKGKVFFEIGAGQGSKVLELFSKDCWGKMQVLPDWAGLDRFFLLEAKSLENQRFFVYSKKT